MQKHPTPYEIRIAIIDAIAAHNKAAYADFQDGEISINEYLHRLFPFQAHDVIREAITAAYGE